MRDSWCCGQSHWDGEARQGKRNNMTELLRQSRAWRMRTVADAQFKHGDIPPGDVCMPHTQDQHNLQTRAPSGALNMPTSH